MFPKSLSISWFSKRPPLTSSFFNGGLRGISQERLQKNPLKKGVISGLMIITFIVAVLLFSGCGYRFSPGGEYIDKNIRTVFIDNFSNRTSEANIENTFRTAFIDQFTIGGRFKPVDRREKADSVFKASINSITISPIAYQQGVTAAAGRVTITMELIFEDQSTQKVIWTNKSFSGYQDYAYTDVNTQEINRRNAIVKLSNDTAERAYRLMMSGF